MAKPVANKKWHDYLLFAVPIFAFGVGLLFGWLAFLNELTAWTLAVSFLFLIPIFCVLAIVLLVISPFFIKNYGRFFLTLSVAIICFIAGVEINSELASKSFEFWQMFFGQMIDVTLGKLYGLSTATGNCA